MAEGIDYAKRSAAVVIAVTLQRLLDSPYRDWTFEETLVFDALRRSKTDLSDANSEQMAKYLSSLSSDQMRGTVSNVKGIFHELLVAHDENTDGDAVTAIIPEETNQPGYDLEFVVNGETIEVVQLKAAASPEYVRDHLSEYPEIDLLATEEVAALVPGVTTSGYRNEELEAFVSDTFEKAGIESLSQEILESAGTSLLVQAAYAASGAIRAGRVDSRDLKSAMGDIGIGLTTAIALDALLGGVA